MPDYVWLLNVADVSAGVSYKLHSNGFAGKSRTGKLKMVAVWVPSEGRIEAKAEPQGSR